MFSTLVNAWKIKDIRTKMLYTMPVSYTHLTLPTILLV